MDIIKCACVFFHGHKIDFDRIMAFWTYSFWAAFLARLYKVKAGIKLEVIMREKFF